MEMHVYSLDSLPSYEHFPYELLYYLCIIYTYKNKPCNHLFWTPWICRKLDSLMYYKRGYLTECNFLNFHLWTLIFLPILLISVVELTAFCFPLYNAYKFNSKSGCISDWLNWLYFLVPDRGHCSIFSPCPTISVSEPAITYLIACKETKV